MPLPMQDILHIFESDNLMQHERVNTLKIYKYKNIRPNYWSSSRARKNTSNEIEKDRSIITLICLSYQPIFFILTIRTFRWTRIVTILITLKVFMSYFSARTYVLMRHLIRTLEHNVEVDIMELVSVPAVRYIIICKF